MTMERIQIDLVKESLPQDMHGACAWTGDHYIVLLNTERTAEQQEEDFLHEMLHIYRKDHFSEDDVQKIEARADAFFSRERAGI